MTSQTPNVPDSDQIRRAPKVLLHDHLDGGLRPGTIVELARAQGYDSLPETEADKLGVWFREAADSGSLERYLETFAHTCAVMQTRDALFRVAAECAEDLAEDGVVYAEIRYAPEQHLEGGLTLEEVVEAVNDGFREGERNARANGHRIRVGRPPHRDAARGPRAGDRRTRQQLPRPGRRRLRHRGRRGRLPAHPPTSTRSSTSSARTTTSRSTRAEAFGLPSIWQALQWCGADRLGHGVRIIDDIEVADDGSVTLGRLASYVRDKRIPLEMCPTSNLQTGAAASYAEHPIGLLRKLHFRITVNTDNRLMSGTSMTGEFERLTEAFGYTLDDMQWFTVNAMKSAFIPFDERLAMINDVVKPGYAELKSEWLFRQTAVTSGSTASAG